jgi:hypothetical protein
MVGLSRWSAYVVVVALLAPLPARAAASLDAGGGARAPAFGPVVTTGLICVNLSFPAQTCLISYRVGLEAKLLEVHVAGLCAGDTGVDQSNFDAALANARRTTDYNRGARRGTQIGVAVGTPYLAMGPRVGHDATRPRLRIAARATFDFWARLAEPPHAWDVHRFITNTYGVNLDVDVAPHVFLLAQAGVGWSRIEPWSYSGGYYPVIYGFAADLLFGVQALF